jgi:hypothetical protein
MKRFNVKARQLMIMHVKGLNRDLAEDEVKALGAAAKVLLQENGHMLVDFVSIEPAEWPDPSMGWPEPGKSYAQMMTDGFRIIARSSGKLFECRVTGDNARCQAIKGDGRQ